LFSFFARRYRKRFTRKGFEPSQKQLLAGLRQAGYGGKMVLEIGSGVGHLHQTLLEQGAQSAVGIDLASSMVEEAEAWAVERGLSEHGGTPGSCGCGHTGQGGVLLPRCGWISAQVIE